MDKATEIWLNRLDRENGATNARLDVIQGKVDDIDRDIAGIKVAIQPKDLPLWVRSILVPLAVGAILATVGAVIHLEFTVAGIEHGLTKANLYDQAALSLDDFKATLPDLATNLARAKKQHIRIAPKVVMDIQQKLVATDVHTQGFWPAAAELISYRSQITFPDTANLLDRKIPDCTDSEPFPAKTVGATPPGGVGKLSNAYYQNCRFTLDSPKDDAALNEIILHDYPAVEFRHCLIVYKGGTVSLIVFSRRDNVPLESLSGEFGPGVTATYHGPSIIFQDCLFNFSATNQVPQNGQVLTTSLLAQSGPSFTLPIQLTPS